MPKELNQRLEKIDKLGSKADSILLFSGDPNFFYLTNMDIDGVLYYDFKKPILFTNIMEKERAKKSWIKDVRTDSIKDSLKNKIGLNFSSLTISQKRVLGKIKSFDISKHLREARVIKTDYEIKTITKACEISKKVWGYTEKQIDKSITEIDLKNIMESKMALLGVEKSFPTIVASGSNSKFPHHSPTDKKLEFPIVIDFGVKYNGYCSDITRTIGSNMEGMVLKILDDLYSEMDSSKNYMLKKSDQFVRKSFGNKSKFFIHSLGHGIGIEVHESPSLSPNSKDILKNSMVFTIEPGLYDKKGIRIENDFVFKNGLKNLTNF